MSSAAPRLGLLHGFEVRLAGRPRELPLSAQRLVAFRAPANVAQPSQRGEVGTFRVEHARHRTLLMRFGLYAATVVSTRSSHGTT